MQVELNNAEEIEKCLFCQQACDALTFKKDVQLVADPSEGISLGCCVNCGQRYLYYFLEHRDDLFEYYCPISAQRANELKANSCPSRLCPEIRAIIYGQRVFFKTPWRKGWASGASVLVEPRPW